MKDKSLTYHRADEDKTPVKVSQEGIPPHDGMVSIFCSASSENAPLNSYVSQISEKLVGAGKRIICGGGDRYTMGAILQGVMNYRNWLGDEVKQKDKLMQGYIAGISTHPIAAAETNSGEMPEDYSYRELTENIYDRMAKMMVPSKTVLVAPGGAGTIQEWMGFNLLKKKMPELFKHKKLVIFDPDLMVNPTEKSYGASKAPFSFQNRVFDDVLKTIFKQGHSGYRLNHHYNHSGTQIVSTVEDAVAACQDSEIGFRYSHGQHGMAGRW